ncbi:MAG TPA: hypothetical protein VF532_21775 [Candidatus Angelobacter sp.]
MKLVKFMLFVLLGPSLLLGQNNPPSNSPAGDTNQVADQIKALQAAIADQQKQLEALQRQLQEPKNPAPQVVSTSLNTAGAPESNTVPQADVEKPKESPLSFRIGGTDFTPGGFVDFENVFRTTNSGSAIATNFGIIPFNNQAAGHLTEYRMTGQYSRANLKINGKYAGNDITGYIEADFNGNDAATVFQTSNPHTFRLRLYWGQLKRGTWEFLFGQSWGLETPNRVGVSPLPQDLAITLNEDANIQVGIPYTRAGLFRLTWHPSKTFAWAAELQNAQQFSAGTVVFPAAFATTLNGQFDPNGGANIPNVFPDVLSKLAWDLGTNKHFHFEAGGILTFVKVATQTAGLPAAVAPFNKETKVGGGVMGATNFELTKKFRILGNAMYGPGIGRYMIAQGPDAVVAPIVLTPTTFNARPSVVHSGAVLAGFEWQLGAKTQVAGYVGAFYFGRNFFLDPTQTPTKIIGFGGPGSANSNNRVIQEPTLDLVHTFWKNPSYGALVLINQASYLNREPWFVAVTPVPQPKSAHLFMDFLSLRYVLP